MKRLYEAYCSWFARNKERQAKCYDERISAVKKRYSFNSKAFIWNHLKLKASLELKPIIFGIVSSVFLFSLLQVLLSLIKTAITRSSLGELNAVSNSIDGIILMLVIFIFVIVVCIALFFRSFKDDKIELQLEEMYLKELQDEQDKEELRQ